MHWWRVGLPRFWNRDNFCKVTRWLQFLSCYCIHWVGWPWVVLKVQIGHTKVNIELIQDFDMDKYQVTTWYMQFAKSSNVHKIPDAGHHPPRQQYPSTLRGWRVEMAVFLCSGNIPNQMAAWSSPIDLGRHIISWFL